MLKQSVCAPIIKPAEVPYSTFLPQIARIGYQAVEFWQLPDNLNEIYDLCQENNLIISSFTGHADIAHGMNRKEDHSRIMDELSFSLEIAEKYNIHGIICFSGSRNPDQPRLSAIENCVECLVKLAPLAEQRGVNLNMELLNSIVDHPVYDCDHTDWGIEVVQLVNSPNIKLLYDIYHMQIMEGNIIDTIRKYHAYFGHVHTAGVPGRFDLDEHQELNYSAICKAFAEVAYAHYIGHEFTPRTDYLSALQHAYHLCNVVS